MIKRMGENKAIIFSTHILEEVEAACSRAIIIDRGRVVADGTPAQLKERSPNAGSLRVVIRGASGGSIKEEISKTSGVQRVEAIESTETGLVARVLPGKTQQGGDVAAAIAGLAVAKNWKLQDLHQEEGRLDEIFRSITRSDTVA
jgi:ABC-2 type transport system ATP-binding protein